MGLKRARTPEKSKKGEPKTKKGKKMRTPPKSKAEEPITGKVKWTNKERVLIFSSRGISHQHRHLMTDFRAMMPHSKSDTKMDRKDQLSVINEICEMKNCSKVMFFEAKKKMDLYMWLSNAAGQGPSVKFLVENVHTMSELKMTGNCLKGSRPLLSFSQEFETEPHLLLLKELFTQIFGTPNHHPKSQPFFDHVFNFSVADNRVFFRNYQMLDQNGELAEIGPRMVLNPIRIFKGSFFGETLYQNPHYVSPNQHRSMIRKAASNRYVNKVVAQKSYEDRRPEYTYASDPTDAVFETA